MDCCPSGASINGGGFFFAASGVVLFGVDIKAERKQPKIFGDPFGRGSCGFAVDPIGDAKTLDP